MVRLHPWRTREKSYQAEVALRWGICYTHRILPGHLVWAVRDGPVPWEALGEQNRFEIGSLAAFAGIVRAASPGPVAFLEILNG